MMKIPYAWLKDFVEIKISPQALADRLTMAGLEVTSLEERYGDTVFEIEVTSNRSDCLSVIGVAREVAAITGKKLRLSHATRHTPHVKNLQRAACSVQPFSIKIEDKKDCPLYTAKIIKDVKVGPSPDWLKKRLEQVGCRSVNNIVDITNYVLFEWGEPLHTFDLDKLSPDAIIVRRAKREERITTIDGQERLLDPDTLIIADKEKPIAIAGVMGSQDTEVKERTKNILLEAAVFNPIIVRRGRQRLGIQSESSYRFERGVDLEIVQPASWRAVELVQNIATGKCVLIKSSGVPQVKKKRVNLDVSAVRKILGVNIKSAKIKGILNNLGFKVTSKTKNKFRVEISSHRLDVNLEIDLIEEIARIFGYEHMAKTLPAVVNPQRDAGDTKSLISLIKNTLVALGLNEVITYSLIDKDSWKDRWAKQSSYAIEILNPLSKEQGILRPNVILSLARCIAYNLNQKQDYINIFEITKVFSLSSGQPQEELVLGIALCGMRSLFVFEQGLIKERLGLLHLKGILGVLFKRLGIKDYNFNLTDNADEIIVCVNKERMGAMSGLEKNILDQLDIKNKEVLVAEFSLDRLLSYANLTKRFVPLPVYPGVSRDISLILKEDIKIDEILEAIKQKAQPLLREIRIIDYYKGKQIPAGFKGLTISCLYRSDERTLTEAEINPLHSLISAELVDRFSAQIR